MISALLFIAAFITYINSQVVDVKNPVVILDGGNSTENNLFGYSLAFIKGRFGGISFEQDQNSQVHGTLFIGAPKETRLSRNSGVIWGCQFSENAQVACSILSGISNKGPMAEPACRRQKASEYFEKENTQWIGASLAATNEHLFACAPRWKLNGYLQALRTCSSDTAMLGACYKATSVTGESTVLGPYFLVNNFDSVTNAEYGLSSHVTHSQSFLVGAPYGGLWSDNNPGMYVEHIKRNEYNRERTLIHHANSEGSHSLLGYSITSGRTGAGGVSREYVAVGAPRSNELAGSVLINSLGLFSPALRIIGEGFGSFFGYALATANLDGDENGRDELLVGAPFFTPDFNSGNNFDSGCVFVYAIDLDLRSHQQIAKICLEKISKRARLGAAIVNLGDMNFDNNEDFAVAAPYHDDGVGTVFIYYGGSPLSTKPAQIVSGKGLNVPNLRGFGTHLLGEKLDIDGNGTPDLAVSSFESNHVVVLRTRPIAIASIKLSFHSADSTENEAKIYKLLPSPTLNRFRVRVCVTFTFSVLQPNENLLESWMKFELDKRIELIDNDGNYERKYNFSSTGENCLDVYLRVKKEFLGESSEIPVQFRAGLYYNATEPRISQPVQQAVLNLSQAHHEDFNFQRAFKYTNYFLPWPIPLTFSDWEKLEIAEDNCDSDGIPGCDPKLKLNLTVHLEDKENPNRNPLDHSLVMRVGQTDKLLLQIILKNYGETAYRPSIRVSAKFTEGFELPQFGWQWQVHESSGKTERISVNLPKMFGNLVNLQVLRRSRPLQYNAHTVYELLMTDLDQIKVKDNLKGKLEFQVEAFPEGQETKEKVVDRVGILMEAKVNIEIKAVSTSKTQTDIDPRSNQVDFVQLFILKNTGFSSTTLEKVKAEILIPTHLPFDKNWVQVIAVVILPSIRR
ncbi:unnamed protein product [Orchesella dallaii]|uniref:Integrin alpha-2 domain-containing protein n=1 Tax=Orchesella dallaii TaxID=48710 RepID=A0ABP1QYS2_9HEXA